MVGQICPSDNIITITKIIIGRNLLGVYHGK